MFTNVADLNGHFEASRELAVPEAVDLPKNTAPVMINGQQVAPAESQSFTHFEPTNDASSGATTTRALALPEGSSAAQT